MTLGPHACQPPSPPLLSPSPSLLGAAFPTDPAAAPFAGVFAPAQPLSAALAAATAAAATASSPLAWSLRVEDLGSARDGRTITLNAWSLQQCPGNATSNTTTATATPVPSNASSSTDAAPASGSGLLEQLLELINKWA